MYLYTYQNNLFLNTILLLYYFFEQNILINKRFILNKINISKLNLQYKY